MGDTFWAFDDDYDGFISSSELMSILMSHGISVGEKRILDVIEQTDQDADGKISFKEYLQVGSMCFQSMINVEEDSQLVRAQEEEGRFCCCSWSFWKRRKSAVYTKKGTLKTSDRDPSISSAMGD